MRLDLDQAAQGERRSGHRQQWPGAILKFRRVGLDQSCVAVHLVALLPKDIDEADADTAICCQVSARHRRSDFGNQQCIQSVSAEYFLGTDVWLPFGIYGGQPT